MEDITGNYGVALVPPDHVPWKTSGSSSIASSQRRPSQRAATDEAIRITASWVSAREKSIWSVSRHAGKLGSRPWAKICSPSLM